ncbi:MAG: 2,3-bisphosphoglycerate-independent phosphoglycerate mutase [Candidatus Electryonea clarkiae]|nr:2,3-bisphosphoglycerate-independent phosphoglycerate mutase [Candidatus Electryonea clarkiae]MDP8287204.1 2,3-bisphosphoglycerate-independent phosphoglycerate mutase [Candidatus Electryonea clarkiae]
MKLITEQQVIASDQKIVMLIADGLGGLPLKPGGPTELEAAKTPNLDRLAYEGCQGLLDPIGPGITPGSGPAHLALFGYDPIEYNVGRGLLSALGLDFDLHSSDVAARGNFCTLDADGNVLDRRAGRIPSIQSEPLCSKMESEINLGDIKIHIRSEKDHRFLLVLRGQGLSDQLHDTDSQQTGVPPLKCQPLTESAARSARIVDDFVVQARRLLADQEQANGVLLRGFAHRLPLPTMADRFGLRAAALADYPMYRGLAKLVGMEVISRDTNIETRYKVFDDNRDDYDFFYIHFKKTDATGEDGDFDAKVAAIEELDATIPALMETNPDVLVVTGDHSTPAAMAAHSWHPVPVLLHGGFVRQDAAKNFGEQAATQGSLGRMPMMHLMPIAMAHANKLAKFGA